MIPVRGDARWTGFSDEIILKALEEIEVEGPRVLEDFRMYHVERRWPTHDHYPIRNAFVDTLCRYWEQWTQKPIPRTRRGGPAAKFVFHALDPFLKYAEREFDQKWLNKWPLDEDRNQVNEMILAYLRHSAKME